MGDLENQGEVGRRALLRGAAVGGTLLWAAPVVQAFSPAAEAGTAAPSLSYVAVLLKDARIGTAPPKYYRLKFNAGLINPTVEQGPTWTPGDCVNDSRTANNPAFYKNGAGLPARTNLTTPVPADVLTHFDIYTRDGGFYIVLGAGVQMVDWLVHKGRCCAYRTPGTAVWATCQPNTGGTYKVSFVQYVNDGARSGNQYLFPAGPNDATCSTIGNTRYVGTCVTPVGTPHQ